LLEHSRNPCRFTARWKSNDRARNIAALAHIDSQTDTKCLETIFKYLTLQYTQAHLSGASEEAANLCIDVIDLLNKNNIEQNCKRNLASLGDCKYYQTGIHFMTKQSELIRIFIGYDEREPLAYHICSQSLLETSSLPLSITPLRLNNLKKHFDRPRESTQLTDFSYTRFLVPYLCQYDGFAIFMDGDMLIREDIANLWEFKDKNLAVKVVKHPEFQGTHTFLDTTVKSFPKFNWSSVMLFNNAKCRALTPEYLKTVPYEELHQFKWLPSEDELGDLPAKWNHLVQYYPTNPSAALVHWTLGGPYLGDEYKQIEFADEWFAMKDKALRAR
jgi:hypothetical protein